MKTLYFKNYKEFADKMIDEVENIDENYNFITAALFYEDARNVVAELLKNDKVKIDFIELASQEVDNYDHEYYISLDGEYNLSVEKAWYEKYREAGYYINSCEILFMEKSCDYEIITTSEDCCAYIVSFEEEPEEGDDEVKEVDIDLDTLKEVLIAILDALD